MDDFSVYNPDEIVSILNPSANDFTLEVADIHNKGMHISYTVKSRESLKLPRYAAQHVSERLVQYIESRKTGILTQKNHQDLLKSIRMYEYEE